MVPLKMLNILLVDDDSVDVMNVQRAFKKSNIQSALYVASDGKQALDMLHEGRVPSTNRLILLDLNMPRMNGLEFLRAIRADPDLSSTPVVVLTTSNDDRDRVQSYAHHVAGYLLKPVTSPAFVELMTALNAYWARVELP
ncbi:two-component response regulator [Cystobacter fuscus DSM 2262]|uniref:Two-component response regulator n=1 Tax=Cystobacter fuscus (strain ATCC 25194 / DSM 2262 / NBRC 100088 / M29) TaxID=1242864 RepID=S9QUA9_CYSF2|nr:response regulator [Cystobacter fuscus]EPX64909.1 two-component response regulator [Cystobacter fuscus DSM 2262]